jgi:hypothetical protein
MSAPQVKVALTSLEYDLCVFVASQRQSAAERAGRRDAHGLTADSLQAHHLGCLYECACAKGMNRYWSGAGRDFLADDDVGRIQVRGTEHHDGRLIVRPDEGNLDVPWVLVTGSFPLYVIRGWVWGRETRVERWLDAPAGRPLAYFVPQQALHPMGPDSAV